MNEAEFHLAVEQRPLVEETIRRHCLVRGWALHAVNARSNHVHVIVTAAGRDPNRVRNEFKAWCTRVLHASDESRTEFWTEGGSCRSINNEDDLEAAVVYVLDVQDRKGLDDQERET